MRDLMLTMAAACAIIPFAAQAQTGPEDPGMPDPAQVGLALDAQPTVLAAQARVNAAEAQARALARGPHEITASGTYIRRDVVREKTFNEYDVQLTRAIRLPGKARLDREIGSYGITAAENMAEDMRHQSAIALSESWWDWLSAARQAQIDRDAVANYEKLRSAVRRMEELREASRLEVDQAEASLALARLAAERSAGEAAVARGRLSTRFPAVLPAGGAPDIPEPVLPDEGLEQLGRLVVSRSHEIAAADADASRAGALAARTRKDRMADPSVGLRVFSERDGDERGAGVLFSIPLGGGHRKALAEQSAAEASAASAELAAVRWDIAEMASTDVERARYAYAAWQAARTGLNAQIAALEKLRIGYRAGEIDLSDQLLGERQAHDAIRSEAEARAEAMRALTRLRIDSHMIWIGEDD
ncbi:TolC family protein [Croceicoccus mobilis]|uniref:Transporter n=1 Tax=Croceicoccus mobilis TaxID=1703339 RepID=A0A916YY34_9SPHN|nr:TolC family protein [Croceicoccus mobilis]GGD67368.1 hypothetical protein GCM10010990_16040 [Croceicoccus mobilis]